MLSSSSSGAKGVLMFGFLLLLVAGLFFVPDLINLQGGPKAPKVVDSGLNPLDRVLGKMNAGYYDGAVKNGKPDTARQQERMAMIDVLQSGPVTWDMLHRPEIMSPVSRTLREAQTLLKLLDATKQPLSRQALFNYINALGLFFRRDGVPFTAKETLDQLTKLDIEVTEAFITEKIGLTEYNVWKAISLGPLLQSDGADKMKEKFTPAFRADVTLVSVELSERLMNKGKNLKRRQFSVNVSGVVTSSDAKTLEIYKGADLVKTIRINAKKAPEGRSRFNFRAQDIGAAPFTFRVSDENGGVYQKRYTFLHAARRMRKDEDGKYKVPTIVYTDLRRAPDTRIDQLFRAYSEGEGGGFAGGIPGNSFNQRSADWSSF